MTSPAQTAAATATEVAPAPVRRSRKRWHLVLGLVAVVGVALVSTACTPELIAKDAILDHWGSKNAPCAERIADRESNFQADAINRSSGTVGLFQIHPTHATWIRNKFGYSMSELTDPYKNAEVAAGLSAEAYRYYGDGWQPWRYGGKVIRGGGCPA